MTNKFNLSSALLSLGLLSACNGGGDSAFSSNTSLDGATAEGLWFGRALDAATDATGRSIVGLVLDDGSLWALYSISGNDAVIGGVLQGNGSSLDGRYRVTDGKNFSAATLSVANFSLDATFTVGQTGNNEDLSGDLIYAAGNGRPLSFSASYDNDYERSPDLALISGSSSGSAVTSFGQAAATLVIGADGAVSGNISGTCPFSGEIAPRSRGNVYDLSLTFMDEAACAHDTDTITGIGYFDAATRLLYLAALNTTRSDGFLYSATLP